MCVANGYRQVPPITGADGATPQAAVTIDKKGNIYGTTIQGGAYYYGVVFEITP